MLRRLLDRYAPPVLTGGFRATLDGEPWRGEFSWRAQINGPSYTVPRIEGELLVWVRYERRFGRFRFGRHDRLIQHWIDGISPWDYLLSAELVR